jgi:glutamate formiminotransferase/formiminotetrahydrofolate cyclodeaminase
MEFTPTTPLVECVPNFSEGRDETVIAAITAEIEAVDGVKLLDVDPGQATHRTVVTFVGVPEAVLEAAFRAIRKAAELIDMSQHSGEHPRMGATDVCPLVPVANITMEETVELARRLGERVGGELDIPIYLYEHAATSPERRNLAVVRAGEYEGLADRLGKPGSGPDYGPAEFRPGPGATAISARDFLIAYNVNLNTTSARRALAIALDVSERGRKRREGGRPGGKLIRDENGKPTWDPGTLKAVKGIGWFIEEYGIAQVSLNLTDIRATPIHVVFDEVSRAAGVRGMRVTGSELIGLIPLQAMLDAGRYFLRKQERSLGVSEAETLKIAVKSMGLDELFPFDPNVKIIEYRLRDAAAERLVSMDLKAFANETASESPAPGGGSIAAYLGALGAALGTMVANLSSHKRGWDERWEEYSAHAEKGQALKDELLRLVDEDTQAYNRLIAASRLSGATEEERRARDEAVAEATRYAIEIPFRVMQQSLASMDILKAMAETGLPSSISDAGVGALCARSAFFGAFLNVKINLADLDDKAYGDEKVAAGNDMAKKVESLEKEILATVEKTIAKG